MSFMQGPGEGSQGGVEVGSKRTSWIVRATILGFIYTLDVLLSKLSQSRLSRQYDFIFSLYAYLFLSRLLYFESRDFT